MKLKLTVSTEDGRCYEGSVLLTPVRNAPKKSAASAKKRSRVASSNAELDFTLPLRAFVTAYKARGLSGPQKLTLLLAGLAKGDVSATIGTERVQKEWNKMTAPMAGPYNGAYVTRAGEKGWIESVKPGLYKLRATWREALSG